MVIHKSILDKLSNHSARTGWLLFCVNY